MLLGGNIELDGFDSLEPAILVAVKKMVGSEAKRISEEEGIGFEKLKLALGSQSSSSCDVSCKVVFNGSEYEVSSSESNLFFSIAHVFKKMISAVKIA